ncbi:hypothetical protein B0H13DRAFT_2039480, partial [Mycena leptocephala]
MYTAQAHDGGRTQSRGRAWGLACLPGLGFYFSFLLFNFFLRACPYIFSSYLTLFDPHHIFLVSSPFPSSFICMFHICTS